MTLANPLPPPFPSFSSMPTFNASTNPPPMNSMNGSMIETGNSSFAGLGTIYAILGVHTTGFLFFLILMLVMSFLLVSRWKDMVFNKKLLYILLIMVCFNQSVFQVFGLTYSAGLVTGQTGWWWTMFHAIETSGMMVSITLCMNCQATITKIIYNIYFNPQQSWMRNNRRNQIFGRFVKISSITLVVILNVILVLFIIVACTLFMMIYVVSSESTTLMRTYAELISSVLGLVISFGMLYFTILNVVNIGILVRKLLKRSNNTTPVLPERIKACRKLRALSFGQVLCSLLNIVSVVVLMLKILDNPATFLLASSIIHKIAIGILCLLVTFTFGPLDNISFELNSKKKQENDTVTTISTKKDSAVSDDLVLSNVSRGMNTPISPNFLSSPTSPSSVLSNDDLLSEHYTNQQFHNTLHSPQSEITQL